MCPQLSSGWGREVTTGKWSPCSACRTSVTKLLSVPWSPGKSTQGWTLRHGGKVIGKDLYGHHQGREHSPSVSLVASASHPCPTLTSGFYGDGGTTVHSESPLPWYGLAS